MTNRFSVFDHYVGLTLNIKGLANVFNKVLLQKGVSHNIHNPLVRVDPENRCACMLIYGSFLVILPFKSKVSSDNQINDDEG